MNRLDECVLPIAVQHSHEVRRARCQRTDPRWTHRNSVRNGLPSPFSPTCIYVVPFVFSSGALCNSRRVMKCSVGASSARANAERLGTSSDANFFCGRPSGAWPRSPFARPACRRMKRREFYCAHREELYRWLFHFMSNREVGLFAQKQSNRFAGLLKIFI